VTSHDKPIASQLVVLREEFDDSAVLFNPDTAEAVGVNPVGVFVWKLLDGTRTVEQLVAALVAHFAGVPGTALDDVLAFVAELEKGGFVGLESSLSDGR